MADALCPNHYTLEEKICWCDEVTAELCRNILKVYDVIETQTDGSGMVELPDGFSFDRIELAFVGDMRIEKQDFRSFISKDADKVPKNQRLRLVYLKLPEPIRTTAICGEFNTGDCVIEISFPPFIEGDKLEIVRYNETSGEPDWDNAESAYVMEADEDKIILDWDAVPAQTGARLAIRRVITDTTVIDEAPYDRMYIEYILAKMALYQHDYAGYNAHMMQYNSLYEALRREHQTRSPRTEQVRFKNYSKI